MNNSYMIGNKVLCSFGSHMGLKGKVVGFIVELDEPISDYFPTTHLEIRTTHIQTVSTVEQETERGRIDGLVPVPKDARHIYFDEYVLGKEYQMIDDKDGNYMDLGILVKKECIGIPYDMDIKLTYQKDGVEKEHIAVFGPHYREKLNEN